MEANKTKKRTKRQPENLAEVQKNARRGTQHALEIHKRLNNLNNLSYLPKSQHSGGEKKHSEIEIGHSPPQWSQYSPLAAGATLLVTVVFHATKQKIMCCIVSGQGYLCIVV